MAGVQLPAWEFQIFKCAIPFTLNFPRDGFPFFHHDYSQFTSSLQPPQLLATLNGFKVMLSCFKTAFSSLVFIPQE